MELLKSIAISLLIIIPSWALEIHNKSSFPIFIESISFNEYNGINTIPSINKGNIVILPYQTVSHATLAHNHTNIITQIVLKMNNVHYSISVPTDEQQSDITINKEGYIIAHGSITVTETPFDQKVQHIKNTPRML